MESFRLVFLLCLSWTYANGNILRVLSQEAVVDPMKFVPSDFTESYKGFSSDIVANEIFVEHSNVYGASAAYTFGLGHILSVINEGIFNISTIGFDEALRTKLGAVTTAYKDMTESLEEDSNVRLSSTIYTSNRSLVATDGIKALKTNVYYQDFSQPQVAIPAINARIAIQTYGKIYDQLIPKGGWYGPSIYSFTKGVFINTFFYKNKLLFPFTNIGKEFFGTDRVKMLSTIGNFKIRKTAEFTTISLPFQDKRKSLVLIYPKGDLKELSPYLDDALNTTKTDGFIETKPMIVQLPAMNFSMSNEYFSQLVYMGINNSMCNWNAGNPYFLQPINQALYYYLDSEKFEVAAASGVQLNNNQQFKDAIGLSNTIVTQGPEVQTDESKNGLTDPVETDKFNEEKFNSGKDSSNEEAHAEIAHQNVTIRTVGPQLEKDPESIESDDNDTVDDDDQAESGESEERATPTKQFKFLSEDDIRPETLRFDKPFYWFLNDEVLGPVFVGVVNSFKVYKAEVENVGDDFGDIFKYHFWSCGDKHTGLLDQLNAPEVDHDEEE